MREQIIDVVKVCLRPGWRYGEALDAKIQRSAQRALLREFGSLDGTFAVRIVEFRASGNHVDVETRQIVNGALQRIA